MIGYEDIWIPWWNNLALWGLLLQNLAGLARGLRRQRPDLVATMREIAIVTSIIYLLLFCGIAPQVKLSGDHLKGILDYMALGDVDIGVDFLVQSRLV